MKKYSTLFLSSSLLLASLIHPQLAFAQESSSSSTDTGNTVAILNSNYNSSTSTAMTLPSSTVSQTTNPNLTTISTPLSVTQTDQQLSIFYQRTEAQQQAKIQFAIWSNDQGQDDLKWYTAGIQQTDLSLTDFPSGAYTIHSYILIDNKPHFLEESHFTIVETKPTLTTSSTEEGVIDIVAANLPQYVQQVKIPVWSIEKGQDDIKWYTVTKDTDGKFRLRVYLKDHQFTSGRYAIHLYQINQTGKQQFVTAAEATASIDNSLKTQNPFLAIEQLQTNKGTYRVVIRPTSGSKAIQSIQVATWSIANKSNIKWRTAYFQNGFYAVDVNFQEHQHHTGTYHNHVYITYSDGSKVGYVADTVDLTSAQLPVTADIKWSKTGQFQATINNVSGATPVRYAVWSDENGKDDIKWYTATQYGSTFSGSIPLVNHKGIGKYHFHVYQGNTGLGAFQFSVTNTQRYGNSPNTYPIGECTWGAKELAPWAGNYWGNGGQWSTSAKNNGFRVRTTPMVGAIAVWTTGGYGHVAVVTDVESPARIRVKESNYAGNRYIGDFRGWFNPVADGVTSYIYPS